MQTQAEQISTGTNLSDSEAHMALVLDNRQGELSPLEIGIHALEAVGKAKAGRGKKGGLSEYAKQIGKSQPYLTQLVAAAEVVEAAKSISQLMDLSALLGSTQHLYAIHALPSELWHAMVEALVKNEWSLADTERQVKEGKQSLHLGGIADSDLAGLDGGNDFRCGVLKNVGCVVNAAAGNANGFASLIAGFS